MKKEKQELIKMIETGSVTMHGYEERFLPDVVNKKNKGVLRVFVKKQKPEFNYKADLYRKTREIGDVAAEVCFLDREAVNVLFFRFPRQTRYGLIRFRLRKKWPFAVVGLARRIFKKQLRIRGILKLPAGNKNTYWLVLEKRILEDFMHKRATISSKIGVRGFLDFLNENNVNYVVLRFFEKLPVLYQGGDMDILVADEDRKIVNEFVDQNPGDIRIDIHSVSSPEYMGVSYYPPPLAKKILASAVDGPVGSRIPKLKDYFLSLAFHVVYHNGLGSGISTTDPDLNHNIKPDNKYSEILSGIAERLGLKIDMTLESLDEYLHQEGWRPNLDTLAKIAVTNEWVRKRFFSGKQTEEKGLGVFILKKSALKHGLVDKIIRVIEKEGFLMIRKKELDEEEQKYASEHLRGGNWTEGRSGKDIENFLPFYAIVILDPIINYLGNVGGVSSPIYHNRVIMLKMKIRKLFDKGDISFIHSTDSTDEAWQYIGVCFPDEVPTIKEEVDAIMDSYGPSLTKRFLSDIKYKYKKLQLSFKSRLRYLLKKWSGTAD